MSTNNSALISSLKNAFNIKFSDEIDEFVLRGIWKRNQYNTLYLLDMFSEFNSIDKSRFEGIIDDYFNNNNISQSNKENSPLLTSFNTAQIAEPDPLSLKDIELQVNNTIPTPINNGYPICGNACMDCCEDVCEHAICCNCASVIYDVWDESAKIDNNNNINPVNNNELTGDNDIHTGFFYNACEDCCEDICEHAICCNCTASIVSHWFEEMDVDNGNVVNPVAGNEYDIENSNMYKLQERAFKHIQKAKKICCFFTLIILLILIAIGMVLFYYLYYKPNYIQ